MQNLRILHPPILIVGRIARVAIQDVHEVLRDDAVGLFRRMELIVEKERIGRIGLEVVAHAAVQGAVMLETSDIGGCGAIEVSRRIREDVIDL